MTIVLLQPDGVPITAQAERQGSAALYGGGSGRQLGGRSGFRVGTPSDTLTATSTTWTLKPCAAMIDPGASTHQGMYRWASDSNVTGTVTASDATYARKDIVFIQVNDSTAGDGSGSVAALPGYLPGVPSATPAAPTLPARSFLVGTIDVPKTGAGSPTVTLNPARFVAAGAPQPATLAERDALTKYDGLSVQRTDLPGRPVETYDGSKWANGTLGINYTAIWSGATNYGSGGSMTGTYWVNGDMVTVRAKVTSGTGASLGTGVIGFNLPAGLPIAAGTVLGSAVLDSGALRTLVAFASGPTGCSVWAPTNPVSTPGAAGYPFGPGNSFEALITYQTTLP